MCSVTFSRKCMIHMTFFRVEQLMLKDSNATWAVAGVPFVVYYTGLSVNTEYSAMCAQKRFKYVIYIIPYWVGGIRHKQQFNILVIRLLF